MGLCAHRRRASAVRVGGRCGASRPRVRVVRAVAPGAIRGEVSSLRRVPRTSARSLAARRSPSTLAAATATATAEAALVLPLVEARRAVGRESRALRARSTARPGISVVRPRLAVRGPVFGRAWTACAVGMREHLRLVGVVAARLKRAAVAVRASFVSGPPELVRPCAVGAALVRPSVAMAVSAPAPAARVAATILGPTPVGPAVAVAVPRAAVVAVALRRASRRGCLHGLVGRGGPRRCRRRRRGPARARRAAVAGTAGGAQRLGGDLHRSKRDGIGVERTVLVVSGQAKPLQRWDRRPPRNLPGPELRIGSARGGRSKVLELAPRSIRAGAPSVDVRAEGTPLGRRTAFRTVSGTRDRSEEPFRARPTGARRPERGGEPTAAQS